MIRSIAVSHLYRLIPALAGFLLIAAGCGKTPPAETEAPADTTPEIFVALGHSGAVTSLAFSPDFRYALSGSDDHTVKLWDLASKRLVRTWRGERLGIRGHGRIGVEFSPQGTRFLAMSWDGDVVVIELATGKKIAAFEHPAMAFARFSLNGAYLLTGSFSGNAKLWSIEDQEESQTYELSSHGVTAGVFLPGGPRAVCGDHNGHLFLLDLEKEEPLASAGVDGPAIFRLTCSPDGGRVHSVDSKGTVATWDAGTLTPKGQFNTGARPSGPSASFSHDGRFVAIQGIPVHDLSLWDLATGQRARTFAGVSHLIDATCFSSDGTMLLTSGNDNAIDLYDVETTERKLTFPGQIRYAKGVACSPDGTTLLSASVEWFTPGSMAVHQWNAAQGRLARKVTLPPHFDIAFSPDLRTVCSARTGWDTETGRRLFELPYEKAPEVSVYSPDGTRVLLADGDGYIGLLEIATGRQLWRIKAHDEPIGALAFSRDGSLCATGAHANETSLKVWSAADGRLVHAFSQNQEFVNAIAFLPDGRHILTGPPSRDAVMRLWDISTGEVVREFIGHTDEINTVVVSGDGSVAVSGGKDTDVKIWDVATGEERRSLSGHSDDVRGVAISRDTRRIASISDDGSTRLWDADTGVELARFVSFEDGEWVVMTPDGHFNASAGGGQHLNVRIGNDVFAADNFFEKYYDPVYVAAVLGGGTGSPASAGRPAPAADIRKGVLPPPRVRILSPAPHSTRTADSITIAVSATDMGGGVDEIRLYHNGKAVGEDTRGMRPIVRANETVRTYVPSLVEGVNHFRAVAYNRDRTESHPAEVTVVLEAPRQESSLHVLTVGINEYRNHTLNLNFARPDAEAIASFFRRSGGRLFRSVSIREVYNDLATKQAILGAIGGLRTTQPQDAVVIYLAGHGETIGERWYFLPHELTRPEREDEVQAGGVSSEELRAAMKEIRAQKILLLIDACKSGGALVAFRGFEDRKALAQLSRATGVHIVAASTKDQFAAEVKDLGHGVFTYTLLAGLGGQAARANEPVTVRKLMGFIEEQLPGLTRKYRQEAQYPVVDSRGMDFPLVLVR